MSAAETRMLQGQVWTEMTSENGVRINKNKAKGLTIDPINLFLKMSVFSIIRMMYKAVSSSETLVNIYQTT
jgi:hypothetical protein